MSDEQHEHHGTMELMEPAQDEGPLEGPNPWALEKRFSPPMVTMDSINYICFAFW